MFFDVLLSKLFYKEKVNKFQQIYGKMGGVANREQRSRSRSRRGGVSENQIAGAAAARLFFLTAVAIAIATRPFKFHQISVSNTSSSFVSSIHSFACTSGQRPDQSSALSLPPKQNIKLQILSPCLLLAGEKGVILCTTEIKVHSSALSVLLNRTFHLIRNSF
jgi:hypothetical protein